MRAFGFGTLSSLVCIGLIACAGSKGDPGDPGTKGDPGGPATTGVLAGTVSDGIAKTPLSGVAVTATDAGGGALASATTDANGTFSVTVTAGAVDLALDRELYTSPGTLHTGVGIGQTINLAITMNEAASGKPSIALAAPGTDLGYGATVPLTAIAADPNGDTLSYTWQNATAPVLGTVTGSGATGSLVMPGMAEAFAFRPDPANPGKFISGYTLQDRFGIIPIITDTRGQVTATVTVADGRGQVASASLTIDAASVHGGTNNVPQGQRIYVNSGHAGTSAWTLTVKPAGSTAVLDDPTSRTPSLVVDRAGSYTVTEASNTLTLIAGTWHGAIAGGSGDSVTIQPLCKVCHQATFPNAPPDMFTPWLGTGHATMFTRGINGEVSPFYSAACIGCHTVGNDDGVANNGFDDVARATWTMPGTLLATNWEGLVAAAPKVAQLANVQCESCHGPQDSDAHTKTWDADQKSQPFTSPRISYAAENCATCHGADDHHTYSDWSTIGDGGMSHSARFGTTHGAAATGLNASCGRCHVAQGYLLYADLLNQGKVALTSVAPATLALVTMANAEPVTCVACHDPHDATNPQQLRFYGSTPNLPSGFAGAGLGKGALCVTCHNSRNGSQTGSDTLTYLHEDGEPYNAGNPTGYSAPHQADQGDVFTGHNAYFMGANMPMTSKHAAIEDTCVGCHMTLQPKGYVAHSAPARSGHLFRIDDSDRQTLCANCHGSTVNGEGIQAQVESQLAALAGAMGGAVKARINSFAGGLVRVRAWDEVTDLYSSTSASNVVLDVIGNPVTSVGVEENHGQVGFVLHFATPITVPFVTATGAPAASKAMTSFGVQMGAIKDNQATPAVVYALSGNLVRAGWNYFLIEGDQSKGLHNPSFVSAVMNASLHKDLSN